MSFRNVLLAATILAVPAVAKAEAVNGFYVAGGAGINLTQPENLTSSSINGKLSHNLGSAVVLQLGWGYGNGLRAEIEGDYRAHSFKSLTGIAGVTGISGGAQKYGGMVNALYDFDVAPWVSPYLGIGVGYQYADTNTSIATVLGTRTSNANVGHFAYQGIAGAAFPISDVPGLALTTEYRFLSLVGDHTYSGPSGAAVKAAATYDHSVLLGVRYAFGAAAAPITPAAAPAPAAATSRSYLVFFDWDKANLTERARGIIKDAAVNSTKVAYTKIDVNGNADTSGTKAYNQGLSMRRAQAVAAELVKDGVPKAAIAITASGDTHLLVPTGPGVREPQNRRVEINIR